ncbi:MAG: CatB-related O-acetyltransferase [Acidimicrobiales bacterium]
MISVILAADAGFDGALVALQRLALAVVTAEQAGESVETVMVVPEGDPMAGVLEGAGRGVVRSDGRDLPDLWRRGLERAGGERVWLAACSASGGISERTLVDLSWWLRGCAAVFAAGHCLLRREHALEHLRRAVGGPEQLVADLVGEMDAAGLAVMPLREQPRLVSAHPMDAALVTFGPGSIDVGRHSYAGDTSVIRAFPCSRVVIGAFCSISQHVLIANPCASGIRPRDAAGRPIAPGRTPGHHPETATTYPLALSLPPGSGVFEVPAGETGFSRSLLIGNDVWVGVGASILGGITVGDGAVIGSGAVVVGDVPPYAVVLGNPARVVRIRFSPPTVEAMLRIRWWEWTDEEICLNAEWFTKPISEFVARFDCQAQGHAEGPQGPVPSRATISAWSSASAS